MRFYRWQNLGVVVSLMLVAGCVSTSKKKKRSPARLQPSENAAASQAPADDEFYISNKLRDYTVSLQNNRLTPHVVDRSRASTVASKLSTAAKNPKAERKDFVGLMSAQRIAGKSLQQVIETARKLVAVEMKKNPNRDLPEFAKLEIVLAAIKARKFNFAELYLPTLIKSKNASIRSAALNAKGMIAAIDKRLPEAEAAWYDALKANPKNEAARLNLGFYAAKYGDLKQARDQLGPLQGDWFPASGLLVAERLMKNNTKVSQLCNKVLGKKPNHQPSLFNCGLHEFQNLGDAARALTLLRKSTKVPRASSVWAEKAYKVIAEVEKAKNKKKQ